MIPARTIEAVYGRSIDDIAGGVSAGLLRVFMEQPISIVGTAVFIIAAGLSSWDFLERRGLRGTAWAIVSAAAFGLACAAGQAAR